MNLVEMRHFLFSIAHLGVSPVHEDTVLATLDQFYPGETFATELRLLRAGLPVVDRANPGLRQNVDEGLVQSIAQDLKEKIAQDLKEKIDRPAPDWYVPLGRIMEGVSAGFLFYEDDPMLVASAPVCLVECDGEEDTKCLAMETKLLRTVPTDACMTDQEAWQAERDAIRREIFGKGFTVVYTLKRLSGLAGPVYYIRGSRARADRMVEQERA